MSGLSEHFAKALRRSSGCEWPEALEMATDLLADPEIVAVIDLAAEYDDPTGNWVAPWGGETGKEASPEVRALLADWRTNR